MTRREWHPLHPSHRGLHVGYLGYMGLVGLHVGYIGAGSNAKTRRQVEMLADLAEYILA